jgi:predicted ferric reductase
MTWFLIRSAGLTAYALVGASTVWGMFLRSKIIKNWTPGPVALLMHVTVSWLGVVLSFFHAGLLLIDPYFSYHLTDILIPFTGPFRPILVGFGTLAVWLMLAIAISFNIKKWIGQKVWRRLHYTSYLVFGMITVHALGAGTDAAKIGMRLMAVCFTGSLLLLTVFYLRAMRTSPNSKRTTAAQNTARTEAIVSASAQDSLPKPVVRRRSAP